MTEASWPPHDPAVLSSATWQQGASIARVTRDGCLLVVADVIEPDERTSFAARLAADVLCRHLGSSPGQSRAQDALLDGLHQAHAALDPDIRSSSIFALAGAVSLASILVTGSSVIVATIGSCRCYRARAGQLTCLDGGHSAADPETDLSRDAPRDAADAGALHHRDMVTEALGLREDIRPNVATHAVRPGDRLLLCTSAVWASLPGDAISRVMSEDSSIDRACRGLASLVAPVSEAGAIALAQVTSVSLTHGDRRG